MKIETLERLTNKSVGDEKSSVAISNSAGTMSKVLVFVLLVAALTLIAHHAIQQKAGSVTPLSKSWSNRSSNETREGHAP